MEDYLFKKVSENFRLNGYLTVEDFFAIVIWKRNASKTKIKDALIRNGINIENLTKKIFNESNHKEKMRLLIGDQIGISFASAILTICYPSDFTIADYRVLNSLKNRYGNEIMLSEISNVDDYFSYLEICKKFTTREGVSLRDFDRMLWGMDFYDGKNGLTELVEKYRNKQLEPIRTKKT